MVTGLLDSLASSKTLGHYKRTSGEPNDVDVTHCSDFNSDPEVIIVARRDRSL
jgi:hypothetical protein